MLSLEAEKFYFIRVFLFSHDELLDSRKKAVADLTLWSSNIHSLPKFYLQDINVLNDSLHNFFEASSLPSFKNSSDLVQCISYKALRFKVQPQLYFIKIYHFQILCLRQAKTQHFKMLSDLWVKYWHMLRIKKAKLECVENMQTILR